MDKWIYRIQGLRKWSVMVLIIAISVIFRLIGMINGVEFVALLKGVGVAFMASNAVESIKDTIKARFEQKDDKNKD